MPATSALTAAVYLSSVGTVAFAMPRPSPVSLGKYSLISVVSGVVGVVIPGCTAGCLSGFVPGVPGVAGVVAAGFGGFCTFPSSSQPAARSITAAISAAAVAFPVLSIPYRPSMIQVPLAAK